MDRSDRRYSPQELAALLDSAKARAVAARAEAIDAFFAAATARTRRHVRRAVTALQAAFHAVRARMRAAPRYVRTG
jgi:hypothetical protein